MPEAQVRSDRAVGSPAVAQARVIPCGLIGQRGKTAPLGNQEPVSSGAECGVMMEASPTAAVEVSQSEFLFQLLVVAFDQPALLRRPDEVPQLGLRRQRRESVFCGLRFAGGSLDQQPFFRASLCLPVVAARQADPHSDNARAHRVTAASEICRIFRRDYSIPMKD